MRNAQFWRMNAVPISTSASTHKAFSRTRMHGLEADVAFLPLRVRRALLDCDLHGLLILFVGVVLFRVAAAVIFLQICLCPRRQWSCWHVELQYLVLHRTHRGASWASGAAQAAQVVRIILEGQTNVESARRKNRFFG